MNTKALRQKILDLAIHGKLVPQDPNDEPASVLLERIRAEKERLVKEGKIKRPKKTKATSDKPHYPYELPKGWCWTTLGEICCIKGGKRIPRGMTFAKGKTAHIYIRVTDMKDNTIKLSDLKYIDDYVYEHIKNYTINASDLYLTIAGTIGSVGIVPNEVDGMNLTENAAKLTQIGCIKEYLLYALLSTIAQEHFISRFHQVAQPKLSIETASKTPIAMPPIGEQIRIVKEIKRYLAAIKIIEEGQTDLETTISQTKSKILDLAIHGKLVPQDPTDEPATKLLKRINPNAEITSDNGHYQKLPFKIPKSWVLCGHNDILEISGGSQPAKNHFISVPKDNYIRLYQIRDYGDNPIPVYIPEELASKRTEKGDILLARYGGSLGKVFHAETGAYNVAMAKVIFKYPNVIVRDFAYYYYLSDLYQGRLKEISRTAQAGFNSSDFNEMFFPLPPYEEQKRIVNAINKTFTILDRIIENL